MSDRQIFLGNLCNVTNDALRAYCEKYGPLIELSINRDKENNVYHCFAFVTFKISRCTSEFMGDRPHLIGGQEVFVKRALQRAYSSIPERLVVTNRLILQDLHKHDVRAVRACFQKFGHIKKFDTEQGFIDFDDYDDVDRVLLARPHYVHDKEVIVTKFVPSEDDDLPDDHGRRNHRHRSTTNEIHRHSSLVTRIHNSNTSSSSSENDNMIIMLNNEKQNSEDEQPDRIITSSTDAPEFPFTSTTTKTNEQDAAQTAARTVSNSYHGRPEQPLNGQAADTIENSDARCERLEEQFQRYKQAKELEVCALRLELERTKRQLSDTTQDKLNQLLTNQQRFHNELLLRVLPSSLTPISTQTIDDALRTTTTMAAAKKRKFTLGKDYEYYS